MAESPLSPALRQRFAPPVPTDAARHFTLGADMLDMALGGGLARGRLHELWPANGDDLASATGMALMLAARASGPDGPIVWVGEEKGERRIGRIHGPGLAERGVDPARVLIVRVPDARALLRAAGDVARSPAAGVLVIAPASPTPLMDLTATRRLTLFAERSGVSAILLRPAEPADPSAAATRWRVAAAPSRLLAADAPGHPAFVLDLVRRRGGPPSAGWRLEWRRDDARFTSLSGDPSALAGGGCMAAVA